MARRRKEGLLDDLASFPWPVGVGFGVVGFLVLYGTVFRPFAWVALFFGLLTGGVSAVRASRRVTLLDRQTGLESLRAMSWRQFEQLVGEAYRRQGYRIEETGQGGADGGIDLLLRKDGVTTLVQCKQWRTQKIGVAIVREMYGLMVHHNAYAVKIVCTGVFSGECEAFAHGKHVELVDGEALLRLVQNVQQGSVSVPRPPSLPVAPVISRPEVIEAQAPLAPICPRCEAQMVERSNRASGQRFWGCTKFPACRGTVAL